MKFFSLLTFFSLYDIQSNQNHFVVNHRGGLNLSKKNNVLTFSCIIYTQIECIKYQKEIKISFCEIVIFKSNAK